MPPTSSRRLESRSLRWRRSATSLPRRSSSTYRSDSARIGMPFARNQSQQLRRWRRGLEREGIRHVFKLSSPEDVDSVTIERQPLWNNKKADHGPFDIIGDVHGCIEIGRASC